MNITGVSFGGCFGFPELRKLHFTGKSWDDTDLVAFRYLCANSLKLEEINLFGNLHFDEDEITVYESVASSIGSLTSRTALRKLEIDIDTFQSSENFAESITNLFACHGEKPKLENLILHPNLELSTVYQFVNENFNLKSLEYNGKMRLKAKAAIDELLKIFKSNNGIEEIRLGEINWVKNRDSREYKLAIELSKKRNRNEFPNMIEYLENYIKQAE